MTFRNLRTGRRKCATSYRSRAIESIVTAAPVDEIGRKIAIARTRLMMERPFLGALVAHLPILPTTRCRGVATDARVIHYNPHFLGELTLTETQFVLAHEALHCALNHFARRGSRLTARWNAACDHAVNQMLLNGIKRDATL